MHIQKTIEVRLDIKNIDDIYCTHYNSNILKILKNKYNNRCYQSVYIIDVLEIIRRSALHAKDKVLDGTMYIDVSFKVSGIIYEKGEVIHNCKIIQVNNNGTMHAKSEFASIYIKNIEAFTIFKEFDEIPVIVNMAHYNIIETEISVAAVPLVPITETPSIFRVFTVPEPDLSVMDIVNILFDFKELYALEKKLQNLSKTSKSGYKFFRDLLFPYKTIKPIKYGKSYEITIENLTKIVDGSIIYQPTSYLDDNSYFILDESNIETVIREYPGTVIMTVNTKEYIIHLLNSYKKNLLQLCEFLHVYDSNEKIKAKSHIWSFYNQLKN